MSLSACSPHSKSKTMACAYFPLHSSSVITTVAGVTFGAAVVDVVAGEIVVSGRGGTVEEKQRYRSINSTNTRRRR